MEEFKELIQRISARCHPPASSREIKSFELKTGLKVPDEVRALYSVCNGFETEKRFRFLSLSEAANYGHVYPHFGLLAFTDTNDSDPFCVCCKSAIGGYVIRLRHDGDTEIKYRSTGAFVRALVELVQRQGWHIDGLEPELKNDGSARTDHDISCALQLLTEAKNTDLISEDSEAAFAVRAALTLLPATEVGTIGSYLANEDLYIREAAIWRLKGLNVPESQRLLQNYWDEFNSFKEAALTALIQNQIIATAPPHSPTVIRIEPGPIHLDVDVFFRNPGGTQFVVERAKTFLERH